MARQITRIRGRITLLFFLAALTVVVVLLLITPTAFDYTPQAALGTRLNYLIFGPLLLIGLVVAIQLYLRPIADLGHALEIGSTPVPELSQNAWRIALNMPIYAFLIPTVGAFLISLISEFFGLLVWPGYLFWEHFPSALLVTGTTACASLVVSLVCRQWMRPVLLYTAGVESTTKGHGLLIRTRVFLAILTVVVTTLLFTGLFAYRQLARDQPDPAQVTETIVALGALGGAVLLLAGTVSYFLAKDLVLDLDDVTARLLDIARADPMDLSVPLPMLALDEVGDLVRAYNKVQQRVHVQQEQVERKQRQMLALQALSYKIGTVRDLHYLLQEVIRDIERALGYHNVSILLVDEERDELYFAAVGHLDESVRHRRFKIGKEGVVGHAAATGRPLMVNDVSRCAFYIPDRTDTRSELAVPLVVEGKVIGVLNVSSERTGAFDDDDLSIVTALANQIATATEDARLHDMVAGGAEGERVERRPPS